MVGREASTTMLAVEGVVATLLVEEELVLVVVVQVATEGRLRMLARTTFGEELKLRGAADMSKRNAGAEDLHARPVRLLASTITSCPA